LENGERWVEKYCHLVFNGLQFAILTLVNYIKIAAFLNTPQGRQGGVNYSSTA